MRLRRLRHEYDLLLPPLCVVQGAVRSTSIRIGERFIIANSSDAGLRYLAAEGFADARASPANQGDSLILCALFAWLEALLSKPLHDGSPTRKSGDLGDPGGTAAAAGEAQGPRWHQAVVYKAKIDRLNMRVGKPAAAAPLGFRGCLPKEKGSGEKGGKGCGRCGGIE